MKKIKFNLWKRTLSVFMTVLMATSLIPFAALAADNDIVTFATAPVGDAYEGLPLFDGNVDHLDEYLETFLDYIGLDGVTRFAMDIRGDYKLRNSATYSNSHEIVAKRGQTITWENDNAGRRIPGAAQFYEGTQGVSTDFPTHTGMGQTWNKALINEMGSVMGNEKLNAVQYYSSNNPDSNANQYMSSINIMISSPQTDIRMNPLSGRIDEGFSEDPYFTSMMAKVASQGITGTDLEINDSAFWQKAFVDSKHFSTYAAQWFRTIGGNNYAGPRALTEYQAASTYKGIEAGSISALMTSYGRTNSIPNAISPMINFVKQLSPYGVYTLSDNGAETRMFAANSFGNGYENRYTVSRNDQLLWQMLANNSGGHQQANAYPNIHDNHIGIIDAVLEGKYGVTYDALAELAKAQIMVLIRNGILNERDVKGVPKNYPFADIIYQNTPQGTSGAAYNFNNTEHQETAYKMSSEAIVLMKNNGVLPLPKNADLQIAGPSADIRWKTTRVTSTPNLPNAGLTPLGGIASVTGKNVDALSYSTAGKIIAIKAQNGKYLSVDKANNYAVTATADTVEQAAKFEVYAWGQGNSQSLRYAGITGEEKDIRWLTNAANVNANGTTALTSNIPPSVLVVEENTDGSVRFASNCFTGGFGGGFETQYYKAGRYISLADAETGAMSQTDVFASKANVANLRTESTAFKVEVIKEAGENVTVTENGYAIVTLGVSARFMAGEGADRIDLDLGKEQYELAKNVAAKYPGKTIVVLNTNAPVIVKSLEEDNNIGAILYQPYAGQYDGYALARIIFGEDSPTGRLTNTWYAGMDALPKISEYAIAEGVSGNVDGMGTRALTIDDISPFFTVDYTNADPADAKLTYMYSDSEITYPFGHGLSYSEFDLRDLQAPASVNAANGEFNLSLNVANLGSVETSDVVQVYITMKNAPYGEYAPKKQLVSFEKVNVGVADEENVVLTIDPRDFAVWNTVKNEFTVLSGDYTISVGHSSKDILLTQDIKVTGEEFGSVNATDSNDVFASSFAASEVVYREVSRQGTQDSLKARNVTTGYNSVMSKTAGAWTGMKNVNFKNATELTLNVATNKTASQIEVRLDSVDGQVIATVDVPVTAPVEYTLDNSDVGVTELGYVDVTAELNALVNGVHDVYFVFKAADLRLNTFTANSKILDQDYSMLQTIYNIAEKVVNDGYTEESWNAFVEKRAAAKAVLGNALATQALIDETYSELFQAFKGLSKFNTDKSILKSAINAANAISEEELEALIPVVRNAFEDALANAIQVNDNAFATQNEIDEAEVALTVVIHMLQYTKGDKSDLEALTLEGMLLLQKLDQYHEDGKARFISALDDAIKVLADENALQDEVDDAYYALYDAISGLISKVDKTALKKVIDKAEAIVLSNYTEASKVGFASALLKAKNIYAKDSAVQTEVDSARDDLNNAILKLRLMVNKSKLEEILNKAKSINTSLYTKESAANLQKAINSAQALFDDQSLSIESQDKVDQAVLSAQNAINELKLLSGSETPVKTGVRNVEIMVLMIAFISFALIIVLKKFRYVK